MAGKHIKGPPHQISKFTKRIVAEFQKCLIPDSSSAFGHSDPASSSAFDHCDCSCHEHEHEQEENFQAITAAKPDTQQKSKPKGRFSISDVAKMNRKDFTAFLDRVRSPLRNKQCVEETLTHLTIIQDLTRDLDDRIAYLLNRRDEIYDIMARERELHKEWRAKVRAKFEECEEQKRLLFTNMTRKQRMKIIKTEFIRTLMNVDFDHEVEDVYGTENEIFRYFN